MKWKLTTAEIRNDTELILINGDIDAELVEVSMKYRAVNIGRQLIEYKKNEKRKNAEACRRRAAQFKIRAGTNGNDAFCRLTLPSSYSQRGI